MANNWQNTPGVDTTKKMDSSLANGELSLDFMGIPQQILLEMEKYLMPHLTDEMLSVLPGATKQEPQQSSLRDLLQDSQPFSSGKAPTNGGSEEELLSTEQQLQLVQLLLKSTTEQQNQQTQNPQCLPNESIQHLLRQIISAQVGSFQNNVTHAKPSSPETPVVELKTAADGSPFISIPTSVLLSHNAAPENAEDKSNTRTRGKQIRSYSHNQIEKRYRDKISNKMNELKDVVCGPEAKLHKETVLRKAVDKIRHLEKENTRLRQEVDNLRKMQQQTDTLSQFIRLQSTNLKPGDKDIQPSLSVKREPTSDDTQQLSSSSSTSLGDSNTRQPPEIKSVISEGMQCDGCALKDRTRVALCSFLIIFLFFSPLNLLLPMSRSESMLHSASSYFRPHGGSRTLSSIDTNYQTSAMISWAVIMGLKWFVNIILVIGVLVRIFVFGEPVTRPNSERATLFWRHKNKADIALSQGSNLVAAEHLEVCLRVLGRPTPHTKLDVFCGVVWHCLRHALHRLGVGRRLASSGLQVLFRQINQDIHCEYDKLNAQAAAVVCQRLLQMHLTGDAPRSYWRACFLGLSAINLAENAGNYVSTQLKSQMYVTTAMQLQQELPNSLCFLSRYFLMRARDTYSEAGSVADPAMQWLFHPLGHEFIVNCKLPCREGQAMWASVTNKANPIENISQKFKESLLEDIFAGLAFPCSGHLSSNKDQPLSWHGPESELHLLHECCRSAPLKSKRSLAKVWGLSKGEDSPSSMGGCSVDVLMSSIADGCDHGRDEIAEWWAALGLVALHWLRGEEEAAKSFYSTVDHLPKSLLLSENPIPKALFQAFNARRIILHAESLTRERLKESGKLCDKASVYLMQSIELASLHHSLNAENSFGMEKDTRLVQGEGTRQGSLHSANRMQELAQLLCCDWLLATRTDIWEISLDIVSRRSCLGLTGFQHDLESLRTIAHVQKAALPRVYLYEAVARLVTDANPARTLQLLQRAGTRQAFNQSACGALRNDCVTGERERAIALLMACRHLPTPYLSAPGQRKGMLLEAASCLEKMCDKRTLKRCKQILLSLKE
ncbi:sterol regulatory element-binding protein 1 isoform X2 [Nematostella vectensis]|uniref:sterol regulatory element-binding protein 1 isoform X2 n=1 Tax=Nematostella vectensis TaxID=45351 RepID=UPI0020770B6C|nr:sterol regulatory element-binding protein 1 isoform X2 [Nematostella vectensis]